jgi:anti-sigma regulatory factor (Ser/Thr protein kinase)
MKIVLKSELTELARARDFVREKTQKLTCNSFSEEAVGELQLAVTEAVTNIIKHSYSGEAGQRIEIIAEDFPGGIQIILHHDGAGFDPQLVPPPSFDGSREGGFGLFIISKCVDFFNYSTDKHKRNTIRLVKISKKEGKK